MRKPRLAPFAFGIIGLGVLWFVAIGLPLGQGYPSLFHWLRDRIIASTEPRFDRDRLRDDLVAAGFTLGDRDAFPFRMTDADPFKREHRFGADAGGPGCVAIAAWS